MTIHFVHLLVCKRRGEGCDFRAFVKFGVIIEQNRLLNDLVVSDCEVSLLKALIKEETLLYMPEFSCHAPVLLLHKELN